MARVNSGAIERALLGAFEQDARKATRAVERMYKIAKGIEQGR